MNGASEFPRRYLQLWLPRLTCETALRRSPEIDSLRPLAVVAKQANALRLTAVNAAAEACGLEPGLTLADARAREPGLQVADADPAADRRRLTALAEACRRYTPRVAVDAPAGVCLEITGCTHLFADEAALAEDVLMRLAQAGHTARFGVADTPSLAWALARFAPDAASAVAAPGEREAVLARLPPAALRLDPDTLVSLDRLGLKRIAQLTALPRASLSRRFGEGVLERLDEALGRRGSPLIPLLEVTPYQAEQRLAEPVCTEAAVLGLAERLATTLAERLDGERLGGRRFRLTLFRVDGVVKRLEVMAGRPLRDPARIAGLFAERLAGLNEGLEADYGFDHLRLEALVTERLDSEAGDFLREEVGDKAVIAFADRVEARCGPGTVRRPVPVLTTRTPELASTLVGVAEKGSTWESAPEAAYEGVSLRPLRLFAPPEPIEVTAQAPEGAPIQFRWRRVLRRMVKGEGPERLAPEWWRDGAGAPRVKPEGDVLPRLDRGMTRDYYRVEDQEGRRYWVFRQGRYTEVAALPLWFMHGLFA